MDNAKPSLREIFADAAEISDPAARAAFLDSACRDNHTLRERVERLLAADVGAGKFLQSSDTTTTELFSEKPGDRIGRYRLIQRIGRGGGGVVYLAEQEEPVRRRVALKILKLGMDTQSVVARFEAERQALAIMDHPNIARVLDAGATETGRPYFVMELVSGQRLTDYCGARQLSLQQRLELFISVCQAVQHAHQKGIIHRDLKPSNILVSEHEGVPVPKVIDFGIAKATGKGLDAPAGLTNVDQFLGTPAYMSPEQMEFTGRDIDTRADIYSLGVILYELLAGQPPFDMTTAGFDQMRHLIREVDPPRPSTRMTRKLTKATGSPPQLAREQLAAVRSDLDWVVMKCLEKDRARRYETANALAMDLRRHLDHEPVVARPPSNLYRLQKVVRRHRLVFVAAGTVLVVLVLAVIVSAELAMRARRAEREQGRLRNVAEANANESKLRLIRRYVGEGNRLLEQQRPALALPWLVEALKLETGDSQREVDERLRIAQGLVGAPALLVHLAQGNVVTSVALNSDGTLLATGSDDGVIRISDVANGGIRGTNIGLPGRIGRLQFNPDGTRLVAIDMAGKARVWSAASGEPLTPVLQTADPDAQANTGNDERSMRPSASFSPDGKLLLLAWGSKSAQLRDPANGTPVRELAHPQLVYHAAFSADGRYIVTSSKDGTARVWEVSTGNPAAPPLQHSGAVVWAQFSPDGNQLLTVRDHHFVQLWNWREGSRIAPEIPRRSRLSYAALSQDGNRILTTAQSGYLLVYDAATSRSMYDFDYQGGLLDAQFSPVGSLVAAACHDGNVWVRDGGDPTSDQIVLPAGNQIQEIAFSQDGRRLAVGTRGGHARVWELSPPWPGAHRLPGSDVQWVEFDRSGRRALLVNTGDHSEVSVYDPQNCKLVSTAAVRRGQVKRASFSPDGQRILALARNSVLVFDTESGRQIFTVPTSKDRLLDAIWSPDGKYILTAAGSSGAQAWDAATGKIAVTYPHTRAVIAVAISPDGTRVAIAQKDNTVQFWEGQTDRRIGGPIVAPGEIGDVQFSPDGKRLAVSTARGAGGLVEIRDVATGQAVGRPLVHRDAINWFDFSPDSLLLATGCEDHTARVWDAATGEPVTGWLPQDFEGRQVVFSPDNTRLVTRARRGMARLWSARTGEPLTPPISYHRNTGDGCVCFSPDGRHLLVARGGNEGWLRDLKPDTMSIEELTLRAEVLSCTRFDSAAGPVPLDEAALNDAWNRLQAMHVAERK
jgi:eukaryotic-like serine/threonine-protein kinase